MGGENLHGAAADARHTVCQAASGNNSLKTIAVMVACVCATKHDKTSVALSSPDTSSQVQWQASDMPNEANWKLIRATCPGGDSRPITAERVEAAIGRAVSAIYDKDSDLYVGKYDGADCDGNTNGNCIKYAGEATASAPKLDKAELITELKAVVTQLRAIKGAENATTAEKTQLEQIKTLVKAASRHASAIQDAQAGPVSHKQIDPYGNSRQTQDCAAIDKQKCKPEVGCKYNTTTEKCEKDPQDKVSKTKKKAEPQPWVQNARMRKQKTNAERWRARYPKAKMQFVDRKKESSSIKSFLFNNKIALSMATDFLRILF
uniref:Variant surface glycoprotein 1125.5381 n=1 Tax=Trypanosoma brucei TaxID=5691 RepID=A0A1J0RCP6_9TRYP|nr:variant surface glycoprotein 1125.5381 [Trypanosoma brucei]